MLIEGNTDEIKSGHIQLGLGERERFERTWHRKEQENCDSMALLLTADMHLKCLLDLPTEILFIGAWAEFFVCSSSIIAYKSKQ